MKLNIALTSLLVSPLYSSVDATSDIMFLDMLASSQSNHSPELEMLQQNLKKYDLDKTRNLKNGQSSRKLCDPEEDVDLSEFPQWQNEVGYWVGEYTFLQSDGTPMESSTWPYRYDSYKGFITGNISGNKYRQRNVFLYPPAETSTCDENDPNVVGTGTCGVNGNSKIFEADQAASTCTENGEIEGPYAGVFTTKTELVGADNALVYQVILPAGDNGYFTTTEDRVYQSQLTTISSDSTNTYRTRTAQGFDAFNPVDFGKSNYASYYRERRVTEDEFMQSLTDAISEYNILDEDLCKWDGSGNEVLSVGSLDACKLHLDESFQEPFESDYTLPTDSDSTDDEDCQGLLDILENLIFGASSD